MHIRSRASLLCCLLSLLLVGVTGSAMADVQVQFFDPDGNLITGASLDMIAYDHDGVGTKVTLPTDPDGTYNLPVDLGQKVNFVPSQNGQPSLLNEHIFMKMPNEVTGPVPVVISPLGGPANDDCNGAQALTLPANVSSTTVGATDTDAPFCGTSDDTSGDVWYSFVGTGTQVVVSLCAADGGAASYDSKLGVYCTDCTTCIGGNDDFCGLASRVVVNTNNVDTYKIQVHGFLGATGTFTLAVTDTGVPSVAPITCPPPPEPTGACCNCIPHAPENCSVETEGDCADLAGNFQGDGSTCLVAIGGLQQFHASPNLPIPDNNPAGVSHTINIPVNAFIQDVNINIGITHTWQSDLIVTVTHGATSQELWSRTNGCTSGDNIQATADDSGTAASCATIGAGPIHSVFYAPSLGGQGPLAVFNGQDVFGNWTLTVSDNFAADIGTLNFWGVDFIGGLPICTICGDGTVNTGEQCDDGNQTPFDGCTQCQIDPIVGAVCGNGVVETGEECEPPNTATCDPNCQSTTPGIGCLECAPEANGKVTICHIPPGNPGNRHTISVSPSALPAHCNNHGDTCGECGSSPQSVDVIFGETSATPSSGIQGVSVQTNTGDAKGTRNRR